MSQTTQEEIIIKYPNCLYAGDEITCEVITIPKHKYTKRVTFHWADNSVQVIGAHMIQPNVFEFPPSQDNITWYLKYTAKQSLKNSKKQLYVTIDTIKINTFYIWTIRILLSLLFIIPIVLMFEPVKEFITNHLKIILSIGEFTLPISLNFILLVILWSNKTTEFMKRLFMLPINKRIEYDGKIISNGFICILSSRKESDCCQDNNISYTQANCSSLILPFYE